MPIKSLELVGYKTFATKTTFHFADRITAIVGPNGSGKSNIADALRWVLGEQSYSLLRGRKTVDMIFSGSDVRARAGMASASVVFENADGWLPIDFSEVAVTRRAYRDGQNEYLINGQKVRLRDIAELLARAGLAERTYTIIGQGLVDAALSLKAEERRKLFEEAAGIGIYRARREEALKRLDATRRNLERVQDILTELEPRLRSLERQARRSREYEQLKLDLHVLLREWYGYHWHQRQNTLKSAMESARQRETELEKARSRQQSFDQEISALRNQIHELRERLNLWQRESSQLHTRRERVDRDLAVAAQRKLGLEDKQADTEMARMRAREEQSTLEERLARAARELARLEEESGQAQEQLAELESALEKRLSTNREVQEAVDRLVQQKQDWSTRMVQEEARVKELSDRLATLAESIREGEANLQAIDEREQEARDRAAELDGVQESVLENAKLIGSRLKDLNARSAQLSDGERELGKKIAGEQAGQTRLETRLEVLEQADRDLSGYSQGAQALLKAGREGRLQSLGQVLGLRIQVEPEYEAAVGAAMGVFLDAVVIPAGGDIEPALLVLAEENLNASLVPLDHFNGTVRDSSVSVPGALGRADQFASAPEELAPVLEALLGDAWVLPDREAVLSKFESGLGEFSGRLITLAGEVFHAKGGISVSGSAASGLVARPRERREAEAALAETRDTIERLENERTQISAERAACLDELKAVESEQQDITVRIEEYRAERQAILAEVGRFESQKSWQRASLERTGAEKERAEAIIRQSQVLLEEYAAKSNELEAQIGSQRSELEAQSLEEIESQVAYWNTRKAVNERAVADARLRVEERRQALDEVQLRLADLEAAAAGFEREIEELAAEDGQLQTEQSEIEEQLEEFAKLVGPTEERLARLEEQQDNRLGTELEARRELSAAERHHAQAQIQLARRQEALDSLRQRIEDDFGIVAFEYMDDVPGQAPLPFEDVVESLPSVAELSPGLEDSIKRQRAQLRRMGAINPEAQEEYETVQARHQFMTGQIEDLGKAEADILEVVNELDLIMEREFRKTFEEVAREFRETFTRLFGGGSARLVLTDPEDLTSSGVDIEARLPGRRAQGLSLLSGGERSLTAVALVFSLIKVSPTPFCVLDEVDAMLDEANVNRFADLLRELSRKTQFIIITHNRNTVQSAETIYGITMGRDSTSQVLGLKLDEVATVV